MIMSDGRWEPKERAHMPGEEGEGEESRTDGWNKDGRKGRGGRDEGRYLV